MLRGHNPTITFNGIMIPAELFKDFLPEKIPQRFTPKSFAAILAQNNQIKQEFYGVKMQVFLAVVLLKPTKKEEEEGGVLKVVVDPTVVVAVDLSSAKVKALRSVPAQYQDLDSRLEVRVLQFHV